MKTFATVGDRFHMVKHAGIVVGDPNIALCGTIFIPHTVRDKQDAKEFPKCIDCYRIRLAEIDMAISALGAEYDEIADAFISFHLSGYTFIDNTEVDE